MPEMDGVTATEIVKKKYPHIKIIMLTVFDDDVNIFNAIKAGANGYLLKEIDAQLTIAPTNVYLRYNKIALRLLLWSNKFSREAEPKKLMREIRLLYSSDIDKWKISRLILNYNF